ncbi:MAG: OmpA family protein [Candidatus Omnitrophica bacterium]|nr:OmpA family protein [Candidatus Omnitrophota bacterium]
MGSSSARWISVIIIWSILAALCVAVLFKFVLKPEQTKKIEDLTSAKSQYDHEITINLDSFSGYSVIRSEIFKQELKDNRIRLFLQDDQADYSRRIRDIADNRCQFAVFTVDSLVSSSSQLGDWPATIILLIDESNGADAVIAYKSSMPNLNSLDHTKAKLVLTPDSPSDFMGRIITAHFNLEGISKNSIEKAKGSGDVYQKLLKAKPSDKKAFIMWEPDISKALEIPGTHILLDSSRIKGHIVDVLVVQRKFLTQSPQVARKVVEAYLRAGYHHRSNMKRLILDDALQLESELSDKQAQKIVNGILWKNSLENYAHFGLIDKSDVRGLDHLEDIIEKIIGVLVQTNAIPDDPLQGNYHKLFYDKILAELQRDHFHPGRKINLLSSDLGATVDEDIRGTVSLPALSAEEWERLVAVGKLRVNPVSFGRGKASIGRQSQRDLRQLAAKLRSWPTYYLLVVGHARKDGDKTLNRQLARQRAEAVKDFLLDETDINPDRIKAKAAKVFKRGGSGQSVSFVFGQTPY